MGDGSHGNPGPFGNISDGGDSDTSLSSLLAQPIAQTIA